ncbi:unnamed protein product [Acanthoscelides obtectus]|uniref:PiggyBac transposable element-derived protein domain-containing protein n=1 Tax=Acanthoscelides obtectus TaxID=200917 RepID=A0A9P0MAM8_ACAOB|nr:unnamed protein product [Acanthoscelides obtectus]CAK1627285.1 PiggyBac transposable element-derived protein 4 [Acanthoscelides obtectus]
MELSPFQNQNEMQDFVPSPVSRKCIQEINYDDGPPSIHQNNFEYIPGNCINEAIISLLGEGEPHDFYNLLINDEIFEMIVEQTNLFASQRLMSEDSDLGKSSKFHSWTPTTVSEIKIFFGIIAYMGLVKMPTLERYWSTNSKYKNQICGKFMPRNRFELILTMLHFSDNQSNDSNSRLHKVQSLVDKFVCKSQMFYTPARVFCTDESLIPFRGRLIFKQYIPDKAHIYGEKIFKLCAGPGYTWNMKIYSGKEADQNNSIPTKVVLELRSEKLLDTGRMAVTDNYYTSIDLANQLLQRRTHLMGTLRANRRGNPKEVVDAKLKKGEIKAKQVENGISILKWKDKRDVLMLSTYHFNETVTIQIRGKEIVKPLMVVDYNKGKSSVDLSDQFASYESCVRKTVKWYHKIAIEIILGTAIVNSHLLYEEVTGNKISLLDFREAIIDKLLDRPLTDPDVQKKHMHLRNSQETQESEEGTVGVAIRRN